MLINVLGQMSLSDPERPTTFLAFLGSRLSVAPLPFTVPVGLLRIGICQGLSSAECWAYRGEMALLQRCKRSVSRAADEVSTSCHLATSKQRFSLGRYSDKLLLHFSGSDNF